MKDQFQLNRYDATSLALRSGVKWARDGDSVLAAWVADMDYPIAPAISEEIVALVGRDDLGYPSASLDAAVRGAFARRAQLRYGLTVDPDDMVVTSDVVQAIYLVLLGLTAPGDGVVFFTPAYPPFFGAVEETGRRLLTCDLVAGPSGYELDAGALASLVRDGNARCLLLCNPHNPTGRAFSRAELNAVAEIARDADLLVVSDEIHADLVLPGAEHIPIASLSPEIAARTVTLSSASKAFNLAGLRCAVAAFGSRVLREGFERFPAHARGSINVIGLSATLVAWRDCDSWLCAVIDQLTSNRACVRSRLSDLDGVVHHPPEATYLAWLDLRATALGDDPAQALRERARVTLSPGPDFGPAGRGHARLNFATPRPVLDEILDRIVEALGGAPTPRSSATVQQ